MSEQNLFWTRRPRRPTDLCDACDAKLRARDRVQYEQDWVAAINKVLTDSIPQVQYDFVSRVLGFQGVDQQDSITVDTEVTIGKLKSQYAVDQRESYAVALTGRGLPEDFPNRVRAAMREMNEADLDPNRRIDMTLSVENGPLFVFEAKRGTDLDPKQLARYGAAAAVSPHNQIPMITWHQVYQWSPPEDRLQQEEEAAVSMYLLSELVEYFGQTGAAENQRVLAQSTFQKNGEAGTKQIIVYSDPSEENKPDEKWLTDLADPDPDWVIEFQVSSPSKCSVTYTPSEFQALFGQLDEYIDGESVLAELFAPESTTGPDTTILRDCFNAAKPTGPTFTEAASKNNDGPLRKLVSIGDEATRRIQVVKDDHGTARLELQQLSRNGGPKRTLPMWVESELVELRTNTPDAELYEELLVNLNIDSIDSPSLNQASNR